MGKINFNISAIDDKLQKLRALKSECEGIDITTEQLCGSGQSIEILTLIDKQYPLIKDSIILLLNDSICFFENIKESMITSDNDSSEKFKRIPKNIPEIERFKHGFYDPIIDPIQKIK